MKLFEYFDETFCINLNHRPDRLELFNNEVLKYDLGKYTRFEGVLGSSIRNEINSNLLDGEIGIIKSNIEVLNYSKSKNYKSILIIEDDCYFTDEVNNLVNKFDLIPNDWDMLYFGGNHNTHMRVEPPLNINEHIVKLHNTYSAHMIAIKSKLFDIIIPLLLKYDKQIDVIYSELQKKYNVYSFYPGVAKQRSGYSDIQNKDVDYEWLIK